MYRISTPPQSGRSEAKIVVNYLMEKIKRDKISPSKATIELLEKI